MGLEFLFSIFKNVRFTGKTIPYPTRDVGDVKSELE